MAHLYDFTVLILLVGTAFGFIAGEEIKQAGVGNIGLDDRKTEDQVTHQAKYIDLFYRACCPKVDTEVYRRLWW